MKRALLLVAACTFTIGLVAGMTGCGEDEEGEEEEPAKFMGTNPDDGGQISANGSLLISFDSVVSEVKVNGTAAEVDGDKAIWKVQGLQVGDQTLKIEWVDENGNAGSQDITLTVEVADSILPEVDRVSVAEGATINPDELNADGIVVKFSERIDTSKSEDALALVAQGSEIGWTPEWSEGDTQVTLRPSPTTKLRSGSEYTLTISGYFDSAGNPGSAVEITFSTTGVNVPTDGLMLWLKADEGVTLRGSSVSEWADQSGNGIDAKQDNATNQPTLEKNAVGGMPAVDFDGQDDAISFTLKVNGLENLTIFLVGAATEAGVDPAWHYANKTTLAWTEVGGWGTVHVTTLQEGVYIRFGTGQNQPLPVGITYNTPIGDDFTIATAVMEGKRDRLYVKGELVYDEEKRGQAPVGNTGDTGYLGRGHEGHCPCRVAEVLVYTRTLPDDERRQVEEYLSDKYSIK